MNTLNRPFFRWLSILIPALLLAIWMARFSPNSVEAAQPAPTNSAYIAIAKGRVDVKGGLTRLAAPRNGLIKKILVDEGDDIKPGQAVALLDDQEARLMLEQAKAEWEQTKRSLAGLEVKRLAAEREEARLTPLASDNTVAKQELDQASDVVKQTKADIATTNAAIDTAAKRVKVAEFSLEQSTVKAVEGGKVVRLLSRAGEATNGALMLIAKPAAIIVLAELEERFIPEVRVGQKAEVMLEADERKKYSATVLRIGQMVGGRTPSDDPHERQDDHVVDCLLSLNAPGLLIGQRVIVRILR